MAAIPRAPASSGAAGRRLRRAVLTDYTLDEHERLLLRQACRVADLCDELQQRVEIDGPLVMTRLGEQRTHPALVELRQQRLVLARLIVALRVPIGVEQSEHAPPRLQCRGLRGVQAIGPVA